MQIAGNTIGAGLIAGLVAFGWADSSANSAYEDNENKIAFLAILFFLFGWAMYLRRKNSTLAPYGVLAAMILAICGAISFTDNGEFTRDWMDFEEPQSAFIGWLNLTPSGLVAAIGLLIVGIAGAKMLSPAEGLKGISVKGKRSRWLVAAMMLLLWPTLSELISYQWFGWQFPENLVVDSIDRVINAAKEYEYFVLPALLLISTFRERWILDTEGIRFKTFDRITLLNAPWRRIRKVVAVHKQDGEERFLVHYRSRLGLPATFSLSPSQTNPQIAGDLLDGAAKGVKVEHIFQGRKVIAAGWLFVIAGGLAALGQLLYQKVLNDRYVSDLITTANFHELAGVIPLSALYLASIILISIGFGLHAGATRGGSRLGLLVLWMIAIPYLPAPTIHWLVWIAIYSIDSAIMTPNGMRMAASLPPGNLLEIGYQIAWLGFAIAPIPFWLAILAGRKPWRAQEMPVQATCPKQTDGPEYEAALLSV